MVDSDISCCILAQQDFDELSGETKSEWCFSFSSMSTVVGALFLLVV